MEVLKRDGVTRQLFTPEKIGNAIRKANAAILESVRISEKNITRIQNEITAECESNPDHLYTIKEIQRMVETRLIQLKAVDIAIEYISYRKEHDIKRDEHAQMMKDISEKFLALNVSRDNANMDESSFSGREGAAKDYLAKKYAMDYLMSDLAKNNHINNEIYTHDLSSYAVGDHNCLAIPYDHLLNEGFDTRNTDIRASGSLNTASQLVAVIAQLQSLQQFGGVSSGHIDSTLKPFVRKSFWWYYKVGLWFVSRYGKDMAEDIMSKIPKDTAIDAEIYKKNPDVYEFAMFMTQHECHQGAEALFHNLNSLQSRSGGQLPFTSINYGTDVSPESRMVINNILDVSKEGLGRLHRTSIFPCGIFQCRASLNTDPSSPLYPEFRKALESTSKRLYPNYVNLDWSVQQAGIRKDRMFKRSVLDSLTEEETEHLKTIIQEDPVQGKRLGLCVEDNDVRVIMEEQPSELNSTMGCVDGTSVIDYKLDGIRYVESFERAWNRMASLYEVKIQPDGINSYIDTPNVSILDHVRGEYVKQYRIIRNLSDHWRSFVFSSGRIIDVTTDHPFEIDDRGLVLASDVVPGDSLKRQVATPASAEPVKFNRSLWTDGLVLCDGCLSGTLSIALGMDEEDLASMFISEFVDRGYAYNKQYMHRGVAGNYIQIYIRNPKELYNNYILQFEGVTKNTRHIPTSVFSMSRSDKLSFLAGMIDADGYVNSSLNSTRVQIGSTNYELAMGQFALALDLGLDALVYKNQYSLTKPTLRYRVEFPVTEELASYLVSEKKRSHFVQREERSYAPIHQPICVVNRIEDYTCTKYSYDVTTETEHFTVNGIWSHNCRTWNGYDICFEDDYKENIRDVLHGKKLPSWTQISGMQKDGRGNICPVTLILPTLAMEVKKNRPASAALVDDFLAYLDKKIHEAKNMLLERFEYMCQQSPKSASFMYDNHLFVGYKPELGVKSALRHGTLVIGQLGLAECLQILIGCDHTDPKGMAVAHRIEALFRDRCAEFKEFYHLNFGVYYTPAESMCYTAMTKFKERFGVIPNVSEHSFMTNSIHVPVWIKMDPIQKIDIEAELVNYSSGGCITYVELDASVSHNIPALETIVRYAMKKDIPYFAINVPNDQCLDCGYVGDINDKCPECGSDRKLRTRRVTGYLSVDYPVSTNKGKQDEIHLRAKHK